MTNDPIRRVHDGAASVSLREVSKVYRTGLGVEVRALDSVTLEIAAGEALAVAGRSGSGKSTLLHVIGAMDKPDTGTITVADQELTTLGEGERTAFRGRIGFVFQRFHLLPALSALDNVAAPLLPLKVDFNRHERARDLLAAVGLAGRERDLPSQLSGGEQQRVAIARALVNTPGLLLADEPTGNLDSSTGSEVMGLLLELQRNRALTLLIATHDTSLAKKCERVVHLLDGRLVDEEHGE
jgi:putative ABC transport system ATP-binding protein